MKLDVVVPTYNRSHLLRKTLDSLMKASVPRGLDVSVIVVDNNSKDDTAAMVGDFQASAPLPVRYVLETRQSSSHARNAGIANASGDLVGFIDDDEEVDGTWYEVVAREFADPATEFIGGPYLPNWVSPAPDWLPYGYHAAIGAIPPKPRNVFSREFGANLMGGNAVLRRSIFERVGTYNTRLGRSGTGLLSEEDAEFFGRLQAKEVRGIYVPDLLIHHYIAPERLTRNYHRRWVYWRAVSQGVLDRTVREPVTYLLGIPRHKIGRALRNLFAMPLSRFRHKGKALAFANELAAWDLVGFVYGKFFVNIERFYPENKS